MVPTGRLSDEIYRADGVSGSALLDSCAPWESSRPAADQPTSRHLFRDVAADFVWAVNHGGKLPGGGRSWSFES